MARLIFKSTPIAAIRTGVERRINRHQSDYYIQQAQLSQMDRTTLYVSRNLVNFCTWKCLQ